MKKHYGIIPVLLLTLLLGGCGEREAARELFCMDTVMDLILTAKDPEAVLDLAEEELARLETLLDAESGMLAASEEGVTDPELTELIGRVLTISEETGGALDPTLFPVSLAWGFRGGTYRVPAEEELTGLQALTGTEHVHADGDALYTDAGTRLDAGAFAKGYAAGRLRELLAENGVKHAVLSLGGNIMLLGTKADGSLWNVAIADPDDPDSTFAAVRAADCSVVTSGGYQRFFRQDGVTYHHILDPETLSPSQSGLSSATIVSADDTEADALSTALFVMGREKAEEFWRRDPDRFGMILVTENGAILVTEGLSERFRSDRPWEVIRK